MTRVWLLFFGLALALLVQGVQAASQLTMRDAVGQIVICTGIGPQTIEIDSNGQPVETAAHCPDCLILSFVALLPELGDVVTPQAAARIAGFPFRHAFPALRRDTARARGPPGLVLI